METRRSARLPKYDYGKQGVYFVTLCTQDRTCILWNNTDICSTIHNHTVFDSQPVGEASGLPHRDNMCLPEEVPLSHIGLIVQAAIENIHVHYPHIFVDTSVIMPNHVHLLLCIASERGRPMDAPTVSRVINQLKGFVSKQVGRSIWQRSFYDHIIRDDTDYAVKYNYILDNPRRWAEDEYYSKR